MVFTHLLCSISPPLVVSCYERQYIINHPELLFHGKSLSLVVSRDHLCDWWPSIVLVFWESRSVLHSSLLYKQSKSWLAVRARLRKGFSCLQTSVSFSICCTSPLPPAICDNLRQSCKRWFFFSFPKFYVSRFIVKKRKGYDNCEAAIKMCKSLISQNSIVVLTFNIFYKIYK